MQLLHGNCVDIMGEMEENSIDTLITDPPGGIKFMGKQWDDLSDHKAKTERGKLVAEALSLLVNLGIIENWEAGFLLFTVDWASSALRVLKPGASGLVWSIPRTSDLTQFGLRLAGFRVVDVISHLYGSGFPKSYNISKGMDKAQGVEREVVGYKESSSYPDSDGVAHYKNRQQSKGSQVNTGGMPTITAPATPEAQLWDGWGTSLKPAHEDWILVYKPREGAYVNNALKWGVAGLNIDGGRVEYEQGGNAASNPLYRKNNEYKINYGIDENPTSYALKDKRGKMNINSQGRFPADVTHDGSDEVLREFPESKSGAMKASHNVGKTGDNGNMSNHGIYGKYKARPFQKETDGSVGSAARFFYCTKASRSEREEGLIGHLPCVTCGELNSETHKNKKGKDIKCRRNDHPTIKPVALLEYFVCLTKTPTGGIVIDPFMGTGTTARACIRENRDFIGIDINKHYLEIADAQIKYEKSKNDNNGD